MRYNGFVWGSAEGQSPIPTPERTINWYPSPVESPGAKTRMALYPTPGVTPFVSTDNTPVRAAFHQNGRAWFVVGDGFYEVALSGLSPQDWYAIAEAASVTANWGGVADAPTVFEDWGTLSSSGDAAVLTRRGTVAVDVGTQPASIVSNGDGGRQLFIVSGHCGYCYDLATNTLTPVIRPHPTDVTLLQLWVDTTVPADGVGDAWDDVAGTGVLMGGMVDGYFLALDVSTSTVWYSALNQGLTWNALSYWQRSAQPDRWQAMLCHDRMVWLFGSETTEVWYDSGAQDYIFTLHPNGQIPYGIAAPWSAKAVGGTVIWLSRTQHGDGAVIQCAGFTPTVISTPAVQTQLRALESLDDGIADTYEDLGHLFYLLTLPTYGETTWVYDLRTQLWTERGTWDAGAATWTPWRPLYHCYAFGKHLVGDRADGVIYELSSDALTDVDGAAIRRLRRGPPICAENKRLFHSRFTLDLEAGNGTISVPAPAVTLNYSNDGRTWAAAGNRTSGSGALGQYRTRVLWNRLGSARDRVYEVVVSDAVPWRLVDAYVEVQPGAQGR